MNDQQNKEVEVDVVKQAIDTGDSCVLLDVRTPMEYAKGKLKGSINLPVDQVQEKIESVIPDKSTKVFVYCLSGSRSIFAVDVMGKLGYTNVFNVAHGLLAWRVKQFPVEP